MVDSRPNIWQMQSRHDMQGLVQALRYPDPEIRGRAAVALRTIDAVQAVPALKAALRHETDEQTRQNLLSVLHMLDHRTDVASLINAKDVDGLIGVLKSSRPETVIRATRALAQLENRLAVEPLVMLFHNSSSLPAVRLAAAEALLELKSAPAVVTLLGALRRDSWQVRRNAAAVLGQIQAIWAVEPLAVALNDPHPVVRRTAAAALRRIGTAEAIAALRSRFAPPLPSDEAEQQVVETPPVEAQPVSETDSDAAVATATQDEKLAVDHAGEPPAPFAEVETGVVPVAHDTRPADSRRQAASVDTVPITIIDRASLEPISEPAQPEPEASPVNRLIAFFRRRSADK